MKFVRDSRLADSASRGLTPRFLLLVTGLALSALAAVALAASITPARAAGEVTIEFQTSSSHAARHPDLRVTIENNSAGDITSATMSLPTGFMGSLNATPDGSDLGTEGDRCPWVADSADFAANCTGEVRSNAKIGTVKNIAHLDNAANDNSTILDGSVYLTERNPAHTEDAAGLAIVVDAKVSNLDLGTIVVPARLKLRYGADPYLSVDNPQGVDTIVENIPTSITDPDHGTITFTIDKIIMDVMGDPPGGASPMITTPSDCAGPLDVNASFTTTDPGAPTVAASDTHTPENCDKVAFEPVITTFSVSDNGATDLINDINIGVTFPADNSTVRSAIVDMPREFVANTTAVQACLSADVTVADPQANCPDTANLGTATVTSPLLAYPIVGDVIGEDVGGTLPNIYMVFKDPDIGLDARIRGSAAVLKSGTGTTLAQGDFIRTTLNLDGGGGPTDLPSLPLSSMVINLHQEDPGIQLPDTTTSLGSIIKVGTEYACNSDAVARFILTGWNGTVQQAMSPVVNFNCGANGQSVAGGIVIQSGPANGETVTTDEVTFDIQNNTASALRLRTGIDNGSNAINSLPFDNGIEPNTIATTAAGATRSVTFTGLEDDKVYKFTVQNNGTLAAFDQERRTFKVDLPGGGNPADTTAPSVQIDSGPADPTPTADTTPTFNFSGTDNTTAAADIKYQCSLDGKAFQPCGSGATGSYTPSAPLLTATNEWDPNHSFAVRSEDEWGNVSTASSVDFTIAIPFGPAVAITPTTAAARSHPTMEVDITNGATEDIETFNFKMPKGFLGSLLGAPAQCTVAQANAATCPAGSQIGTVEATAQIDQSEATLPGKVYLTEPQQTGDPAGIAVVIDSQVGDLDLQNKVVVKARLAVRGQAEGVDAFSEPMPRTVVDNTKTGNPVITFRARHINMKLTGNVAGTQPFLWAASDCSAGQEYIADFESYDSDASQTVIPFTTTGCDALPFSPTLGVTVNETGAAGAPAVDERFELTANMLGSPNDSGIKSAEVILPKTMTVDAQSIPANICEAAQITAHTCPPESLAGTATVNTPLLATPLSGPVYMARNPGKAVPNLSVQLSGLINIDLFAQSKFINQTQIHTQFASVPDAPMTSFTMNINKMLIVHPDACEVPIEERGLVGTATAFNGKTASLNTPPLAVDCKDDISISSSFKNKGKKSTLNVTATANGLHPKIAKMRLTLPKGATMFKKALKKKLVVTGDGRRLKSNCWKFKNSRTLDLSLCKKQYDVVKLSFKAGSLNMTKKVKKTAKVTLKITSADGKNETLKPPVSAKRYPQL